MKFYEIIENLGITAGEYYDGCYNMEKNQCGFDQPAAVFKKTNGAQAFVVAYTNACVFFVDPGEAH